MPRYIDADMDVSEYVTVWDCNCSEFGKQTVMAVDDLNYLPTADVAPRVEVLEAVDEFKNDLMDVFIGLCGGNDYNRLNLLKIGDTVARVYNKHITELKKKCTDAADTNDGHKTGEQHEQNIR